MRTFEYIAVALIGLGSAYLIGTAAVEHISASLEETAALIEKGGRK